MSKKTATKKKAGPTPAKSSQPRQCKTVLQCPNCTNHSDDFLIIRDPDGYNRQCGNCEWKFTAPKKGRKRRPDPKPVEIKHPPSDDPEQEKLLTEVRAYLTEHKSHYNVRPHLQVMGERAWLLEAEAKFLRWAKALRGGIDLIEGSRVYKRLKKAESKPVDAKDAFKFT